MGACRRVRESLQAQLKALILDDHFNNHKWYRSEEAHRDIGVDATLETFARSGFYEDFAREFREHYCRHECDHRQECDVVREPETAD